MNLNFFFTKYSNKIIISLILFISVYASFTVLSFMEASIIAAVLIGFFIIYKKLKGESKKEITTTSDFDSNYLNKRIFLNKHKMRNDIIWSFLIISVLCVQGVVGLLGFVRDLLMGRDLLISQIYYGGAVAVYLALVISSITIVILGTKLFYSKSIFGSIAITILTSFVICNVVFFVLAQVFMTSFSGEARLGYILILFIINVACLIFSTIYFLILNCRKKKSLLT